MKVTQNFEFWRQKLGKIVYTQRLTKNPFVDKIRIWILAPKTGQNCIYTRRLTKDPLVDKIGIKIFGTTIQVSFKTKAQNIRNGDHLTIKIWEIWISRTFLVSVYLSICHFPYFLSDKQKTKKVREIQITQIFLHFLCFKT